MVRRAMADITSRSRVISSIGLRREVLPRRKYLVVVPAVLVVLQRSIERREPAVDDELGDDILVPIARAGVHALGDECAKVYGLVMVAAPRRGGIVAHCWSCPSAAGVLAVCRVRSEDGGLSELRLTRR